MSDYSDWKSHQDPDWRPAKPQSGATLMNDKQALREELLKYCYEKGAVSVYTDDKILPVVQLRIDKLEALIDAYTEQRVAEVYKLWMLLDDIDTLDDAVKSNDKAFREHARKIQRKRFEIVSGEEIDRIAQLKASTSEGE